MIAKKNALPALYSLSTIALKQKTKPDAREHLLERGAESLSNQELIMILLGCGTSKIPVRKLAGKVLNVLKPSANEIIPKNLLTIEGVGAGKACLIAAALELGRRFNSSPAATVHSPVDVLPLIKHYTLEKQEHFLCASLNGAHEILSIRTVSVGTLNRCVIHPREVYAEAIKERAAAIILAHNHPSGNPEPSQNDIETTQQLYDAAKILGIHLLDHVIITTHDYFSFAENSLVFSS